MNDLHDARLRNVVDELVLAAKHRHAVQVALDHEADDVPQVLALLHRDEGVDARQAGHVVDLRRLHEACVVRKVACRREVDVVSDSLSLVWQRSHHNDNDNENHNGNNNNDNDALLVRTVELLLGEAHLVAGDGLERRESLQLGAAKDLGEEHQQVEDIDDADEGLRRGVVDRRREDVVAHERREHLGHRVGRRHRENGRSRGTDDRSLENVTQ